MGALAYGGPTSITHHRLEAERDTLQRGRMGVLAVHRAQIEDRLDGARPVIFLEPQSPDRMRVYAPHVDLDLRGEVLEQQIEGGGAIGAMHRLGERVGRLPTHFRRRVVQVLGDLLDELGILEPPERPNRGLTQVAVRGPGRSDQRGEIVSPRGSGVLQRDDLEVLRRCAVRSSRVGGRAAAGDEKSSANKNCEPSRAGRCHRCAGWDLGDEQSR